MLRRTFVGSLAAFAGTSQTVSAASASAFIDIGGGVLAPPSFARASSKLWQKIGVHPFGGTPTYAVNSFTEVPGQVRAKWIDQIQNGRGISGMIRNGDMLCSMMFSIGRRHVRWDRVRLALTDCDELYVVIFLAAVDGVEYVLGVPRKQDGACDNWFWQARTAR